jgi:hypothetical protein
LRKDAGMYRALVVAAALVVVPAGALADKKTKLDSRGVDLLRTVAPGQGFVDDPLSFDGAGGRLIYAVSNAADRAQIFAVDMTQGGAELFSIDVSEFTATPVAMSFAADGEHLLVVSRAGEEAPATAAVFDRSGKLLRRFGPATHIAHVSYGGGEAVSTYRVERVEPRRGPAQIRHTVEVFDLLRGRRVGRRTTIDTDEEGYSKRLGFAIRSWADGYTTAIGIKDGRWNRRTDQRSPNSEAWYDLPAQKFVREVTISDVIDHTRMMQILAAHPNQPSFVRIADDLTGVERMEAGKATEVTLSEDFARYEPKSLQHRRAADGTIFFTIQIDPVNPITLERKRQETAWIDLYELAPGATRAVRRARVLPPEGRPVRWAATSRHFAVLVGHAGFSRGGERLRLYRLKPPPRR